MENIRAIRNDDDLAWAIGEVEPYFDNPPALETQDAERFDILSALIEAYEDRHYPIEAPEPIELIKAHMEMIARKQSDLAELFGSKSRASEVLNRKRALTVEMVHKLHKEWGIPAECLITPYDLVKPSGRYVRAITEVERPRGRSHSKVPSTGLKRRAG